MKVTLEILDGRSAGESVEVPLPKCSIGRSRQCHLQVFRRSVSRKHCVVEETDAGVRVRDLSSRFGTFVNGARVSGSASLSDGDTLTVGRLNLGVSIFEKEIPGGQRPRPVEFAINDVVGDDEIDQSDLNLIASATSIGDLGSLPDEPDEESSNAFQGAAAAHILALKSLNGPSAGRQQTLPQPECLVGRSDQCHLKLDSTSVSRTHCRIAVADEALLVTDLESRHGTFVNDRRITEPAELRPGDQLRIGQLRFEVTTSGNGDTADRSAFSLLSDDALLPDDEPLENAAGLMEPSSHDDDALATPAADVDDQHDAPERDVSDEVLAFMDEEEAEKEAERPKTVILKRAPTEEEGSTSEVAIRLVGDALVAVLHNLSDPEILGDIESTIETQLVQREPQALVIDCSELDCELTPDFWRMLVRFRKQLATADVPVRLCGFKPRIRARFTTSTFNKLFPLYGNCSDAVAGENRLNPKEGSSAAQQKKASAKTAPSSWLKSRLSEVSPQTAKIAISVGVLALVAILFAFMFLSGTDTRIDPYSERLWAAAPRTTVGGQVSFGTASEPRPDGGSGVVAWPTNITPQNLYSVSQDQILRQSGQRSLNPQGPFLTSADPEGNFQLELPQVSVATEYYFLFVSANVVNSESTPSADQSLLSSYFRDAQSLIGNQAYHLTRRTITPNVEANVDWQFTID